MPSKSQSPTGKRLAHSTTCCLFVNGHVRVLYRVVPYAIEMNVLRSKPQGLLRNPSDTDLEEGVAQGMFKNFVDTGFDFLDQVRLGTVGEENVVGKVSCRVEALAPAAPHVLRPARPKRILVDVFPSSHGTKFLDKGTLRVRQDEFLCSHDGNAVCPRGGNFKPGADFCLAEVKDVLVRAFDVCARGPWR